MWIKNKQEIFAKAAPEKSYVLVIHGLTGAPLEMKYQIKVLAQSGFGSYTPLIAGHGLTASELLKTNQNDWYKSLESCLKEMYNKVGKVHILALCAGGTLGLKLAYHYPEMVKSIVIYSPIINYDGWNMSLYYRLARPLLNPVSKVFTFLDKVNIEEKPPYGIKSERIRKLLLKSLQSNKAEGIIDSYPLIALKYYLCLVKEVFKFLPKIHTPLMAIHSIQDDVSHYKGSLKIQKIYGGICNVLLLNDSYHLINIDQQKQYVTKETINFFDCYE